MTRTYRGYTITKTDTGGRRGGREIWYKADGTPYVNTTLRGLYELIDAGIQYGHLIENGAIR